MVEGTPVQVYGELKTKEAVLEEGLLGLQQGTLTGEEQMGAEGGTDLG